MGKNYKQCLRFLQFMGCALLSLGCSAFAEEPKQKVVVHDAFTEFGWNEPRMVFLFDVDKKEPLKQEVKRGPASAIPRDDLETIPAKDEIWLSNVFVEDQAGVMTNMKRQFQEWDRMEEYRRNWDIGSTGLYNTPDMERKKAWFNRMILRYADKRFSGELKNAAEGSTLHSVRNVKQALRPNTEASISKNFKLKFKAKIIQMRAFMRVINPWVESETSVRADGRVETRLSKEFKDFGIRTDLNFQLNDGHWVAQVRKPVSQNIQAVFTSAQRDSFDNTLQLIYSKGF